MYRSLLYGILVALFLLQSSAPGQQAASPAELFNNRIMPIFRSAEPSSCVQCHLSSVDLKDYILPSHEQTFLSLRDQGLVNLEDPGASKILKLIDMGNHDADGYSKRVHADMRQAEYEAFSEWITACCANEKLVALPSSESEVAAPSVPNEVIRHGRKSRVMDSFVRNVWSQRMRCFPCHTPHEIGPKQNVAREKYEQWYGEYGDQMLIFKKTPEATLRYLVEKSEDQSGDYLPLLNLEDPGKSLLILKPMSRIPPAVNDQRVPTYREPVYHMGGLKIHENDHSHKSMLSWMEDYAAVTQGEYKTAGELPADNWFPTKRVLRMRDIPESWPVGSTVQMFVHRREGGEWSGSPVAFTQGQVTPRRIVNGTLILLGAADPTDVDNGVSIARLPPGSYQVRVALDKENELQEDPTAFLNGSSMVGTVDLKDAKWQTGFPKAEWISGNQLSQ